MPGEPNAVQQAQLAQAKETWQALIGQGTPTVAQVFTEPIIEALACIETLDFQAFVVIKDLLQHAKIRMRDLEKALKPHRPRLRIVQDDDVQPVSTAGHYLDDAPLPDLMIPPPYALSEDATLKQIPSDHNGLPRTAPIAFAPLLITGRLESIDSPEQWLRLEWRRGDQWTTEHVDRGVALNTTKLLDLASHGLPVASDNVAHVSHYLHLLEAQNYHTLPSARMATRLGWQGEQGAYGFLCGRTLARADEMLVIDDLSSVATRDWQKNWIAFHGNALGDDQIVNGFHQRGTYKVWCDAIKPVIGYPKVRLGLYASFAVPLLEILQVPNFVIDWSARTSVGKTTTLRTVASVWGCPDERRSGESIIFSWNATKVWSERAAAVLNGLPFILDESKLAAKGVVPSVLYMVANGIGKGRGNPKGLAQAKRWRTILFSTGESPVTGFTEDGDSRMRCLSIRGYPFGVKTPETLKVVGELTTALYMNYGHAGPRFTQWLLQHRDQWGQWEKRYTRHKQSLMALVKDDAGYRLADYGAIIVLAADLLHEALRLPWDKPKAIEDSLWTTMVEEASGAAGHIRALRDLMSWAYAHPETFDGRAPYDREGHVRPPTLGWSGRWDKGKWTEIGFYPHVVKSILSTAGYDPEAILALWKEEGWIVSGDAKHIGKRTRTLGERPWLITFDRTIIEVLEDGGDSGDEVGTEWGQR